MITSQILIDLDEDVLAEVFAVAFARNHPENDMTDQPLVLIYYRCECASLVIHAILTPKIK